MGKSNLTYQLTCDDKSLVLPLMNHCLVGVVGHGEGVGRVVVLGGVAVPEHVAVAEQAQLLKL